jgi:hypothetical protein
LLRKIGYALGETNDRNVRSGETQNQRKRFSRWQLFQNRL